MSVCVEDLDECLGFFFVEGMLIFELVLVIGNILDFFVVEVGY